MHLASLIKRHRGSTRPAYSPAPLTRTQSSTTRPRAQPRSNSPTCSPVSSTRSVPSSPLFPRSHPTARPCPQTRSPPLPLHPRFLPAHTSPALPRHSPSPRHQAALRRPDSKPSRSTSIKTEIKGRHPTRLPHQIRYPSQLPRLPHPLTQLAQPRLPEHLLLRDTLYLLQGISGKHVQLACSDQDDINKLVFLDDTVHTLCLSRPPVSPTHRDTSSLLPSGLSYTDSPKSVISIRG